MKGHNISLNIKVYIKARKINQIIPEPDMLHWPKTDPRKRPRRLTPNVTEIVLKPFPKQHQNRLKINENSHLRNGTGKVMNNWQKNILPWGVGHAIRTRLRMFCEGRPF